jgi:predicted nuclease of predicted toxin-antitoxin system
VKLKLDENIGRRGLDLLRAAGHDVMTVREQDLHGAADDVLFDVCGREQRGLVTLDHASARSCASRPRVVPASSSSSPARA